MLVIQFGCCCLLSSVPELKSSPQTVDPVWDRSVLDPWEPSSKRNNSSSPKPKKEELWDSDLRSELICFYPSSLFVFSSSQASVPSS